jgi:hypothetical protein
MLPLMQRILLVLILGIGCLFFSGPNLADEAVLPSDYGYMLIRLNLTARERVDLLEMSNVDTNYVIRIRNNSFESAGLNAWMALVSMPKGRYFLSEYQAKIGMTITEMQGLAQRHRRRAPESADGTFEIVSGAVNYVGDWTMRTDSSRRIQLNEVVEFKKSTLERYVTQYPEYSNKFEIYLSVMGKEAISLDELVKKTD